MWVGRTAVEIAGAVQRGDATVSEVVREHVAHLRRVEPRVGAYELDLGDEAIAEAEELDRRSDLADLPLAGVPVAIKDVVDVAGTPTRKGSVATTAPPAEKDSVLVANLRTAGAVVLGKTRCPELCLAGISDNATGVALNPWNLAHTAGGSSGGSAAALSSGSAPIALGSDGGGSIRLPSTACGVVGLKPGEGGIHRDFPAPSANWCGMSSPGPMATTVADLALMMSVMTGRSNQAQVSPPPAGLRVAATARGSFPIPPRGDIRRAWQEVVDLLRDAGHVVVERAPSYPRWLSSTTAERFFHGAAFDADNLGLEVERAGRRTRTVVTRGRRLAAKGAPDPSRATQWMQMADQFFEGFDVMLTPATATTAPVQRDFHNHGFFWSLPAQLRFGAYTSPWNLAQLPAAAVPVGVGQDGLPIAVQVVGGRGREDLVLQVAAQIEDLRPWSRHAPGWL